MRRYSAWHKTDPGYRSPEEVYRWISLQENPTEWRIVATDDTFEPPAGLDRIHDEMIARTAVESERRRIAIVLEKMLGIGVTR